MANSNEFCLRIPIQDKKRQLELRRILRDNKLKSIKRLIELEQDKIRMGGFFIEHEELHFLREKYGRFVNNKKGANE